MAPTNNLTGSGLGRFGKQAKARFKPVARRSNTHGVSKASRDENLCLKALEALSLDEVRTQIASQEAAVDNTSNKSSPDPDIAIEEPKNFTFQLLNALPKTGLHFSDKHTKGRWVLGKPWKDSKVVRAMYKDMHRGQRPHKRHVQPLLVITFQTATNMVEESGLGAIEDAEAAENMWLEFFKKLHYRIQLRWPTELSLGLFTCIFSALVDARVTAKANAFAEAFEVEEACVQLAGLGVDSSSPQSHKDVNIQKVIKAATMSRRRELSELVTTIDGFLGAVIAAGTIWVAWAGVEEEEDLE